MPPKKRKFENANNQTASEEYKKKLRLRKPKPQPPLPQLSKRERQQYTVKTPYPQSYSYPLAIISYIARNPANLDDHESVIKSAKSLLRMSRIIPVDNVQNCSDDENTFEADNRKFDLTGKSFDMWITSKLFIRSFPYFASTLLKRIYRCCLVHLELHQQILTFEELKFLASGDEMLNVEFIENIIKNDGNVVEFENVFKVLLIGRFINITFPSEQHGIGNDTARKMVEMLENQKICRSIKIENIPEQFHFASFACFLKTNLTDNRNKKYTIDLCFSTTISQTFKNQLQAFVHEIIAMAEHDHSLRGVHIPSVKFAGHDVAAYKELQGMRLKHGQIVTMSARKSVPIPPRRARR